MSNRVSNRAAQQPTPPRPRAKTPAKTPVKAPVRTKAQARASGFQRTTARLEGRRDGKPLIFNWGAHLTRAQKNFYQHTAAYLFFGIIGVAVLGVLAFGLLAQNVFIPNQAIASVNGTDISQDTYRKHLAYDAQTLWNRLQSEIKQHGSLSNQSQQANPNAGQQLAILAQAIQADKANFQQSAITTTSVNELVEDRLIQAAIPRFEQQNHASAAALEPGAADIAKQLSAFKAAFPAGETYQDFLSKNSLSDSDVRSSIALHLRRDLMQKYLQSLLISPARQVHLRSIATGNAADAAKVHDQLVNHHADWGDLAKKMSLDANTKNTGGDLGWVPSGTGDAGIEVWAYAPERKVDDISPVIRDASGTFDVVQVLEIDPSRAIAQALLDGARSNALDHWLGGQKVAPYTHLTNPNQDMVTASRNLPTVPDLNSPLPSFSRPGQSPGGIPPGNGP